MSEVNESLRNEIKLLLLTEKRRIFNVTYHHATIEKNWPVYAVANEFKKLVVDPKHAIAIKKRKNKNGDVNYTAVDLVMQLCCAGWGTISYDNDAIFMCTRPVLLRPLPEKKNEDDIDDKRNWGVMKQDMLSRFFNRPPKFYIGEYQKRGENSICPDKTKPDRKIPLVDVRYIKDEFQKMYPKVYAEIEDEVKDIIKKQERAQKKDAARKKKLREAAAQKKEEEKAAKEEQRLQKEKEDNEKAIQEKKKKKSTARSLKRKMTDADLDVGMEPIQHIAGIYFTAPQENDVQDVTPIVPRDMDAAEIRDRLLKNGKSMTELFDESDPVDLIGYLDILRTSGEDMKDTILFLINNNSEINNLAVDAWQKPQKDRESAMFSDKKFVSMLQRIAMDRVSRVYQLRDVDKILAASK